MGRRDYLSVWILCASVSLWLAPLRPIVAQQAGKTPLLAVSSLPEPIKFEPQPATFAGNNDEVWSIAYSPDGETIATCGADKVVKLCDVTTGKIKASLEGHTDAVTCVAFSHDGQTLASASYDRTVKLWNLATRQVRSTLT